MRCPNHPTIVKQSKHVTIEGVGVLPVQFCPVCDHWKLTESKLLCSCGAVPERHRHVAINEMIGRYNGVIRVHNRTLVNT